MSLADKKCVPLGKGAPSLSAEQEQKLRHQVSDWQLLNDGTHKLRREFKHKNFKDAMAFVNNVAEIAESEGHHPDISISYNKVQLELFTHAIGGLSENDFIMAAKINQLVPV